MPQLGDALHLSAEGAAYADTPEGYRVLVARKHHMRHPGGDTRFLVRVERGAAPPTDAFDAPDFPTARALLATFDLAGFDPVTAAWQPATEEIVRRGAPWVDDVASQALPRAP